MQALGEDDCRASALPAVLVPHQPFYGRSRLDMGTRLGLARLAG